MVNDVLGKKKRGKNGIFPMCQAQLIAIISFINTSTAKKIICPNRFPPDHISKNISFRGNKISPFTLFRASKKRYQPLADKHFKVAIWVDLFFN